MFSPCHEVHNGFNVGLIGGGGLGRSLSPIQARLSVKLTTHLHLLHEFNKFCPKKRLHSVKLQYRKKAGESRVGHFQPLSRDLLMKSFIGNSVRVKRVSRNNVYNSRRSRIFFSPILKFLSLFPCGSRINDSVIWYNAFLRLLNMTTSRMTNRCVLNTIDCNKPLFR